MRVMDFPLTALTMAGCWPPMSWSPFYKRTIYKLYTYIVMLLLFTFMLPQFLVVVNANNTDDFTETFYVNLLMIMGFCKMLGLVLNRKNIETITKTLVEKPLKPLEPDEITIRQKFDNTIQLYAKWYAFMIWGTCMWMNVSTFFTNFRRGELAYQEWIPYEYRFGAIYYFTYFRQLISLTAAAVVNVACDSMICGLLVHISCQIEILKCRLRKSLRTQSNMTECICQHDHIYKFAYTINDNFRGIIAVQFAISTLGLCVSMYKLGKTPMSAEYAAVIIYNILYTVCMSCQILIYCWFSNEVKLQSVKLADDIFQMDWVSVNRRFKQALIMIMNRSLIPIEFSTAYVLTMNVESFVQLVKLSYSAYNILQHT